MMKKVPHYVDSALTREMASSALQGGEIVAACYKNKTNSQSVVHSHPYYELVLPIAGSCVRYSVDGSLYDLRVGELILFPAGVYHSGRFNLTLEVSERLVVQIHAGLWERASRFCGLSGWDWRKQPVVLDADAVSAWDLRGLLERLSQTVYLSGSVQKKIQLCEVTELLLFIGQVAEGHRTAAPSATSVLAARAVAYLQENYTDPRLTVAELAKATYTSREHLSRIFKEYTMESVHGYLTNLRMQHCRRALTEGVTVLEASTSSGFSNYSSFLKRFRMLYGMTPSEYRVCSMQESRKREALFSNAAEE